ncbi:MAG: glycosyltransferase [bacterium]
MDEILAAARLRQRVLLVGSGAAFGGTEQVFVDSARRLARAGWGVDAWVAPSRGADAVADALREAGAGVERWPEVLSPGASAARAVSALRERAPRIVHLHLAWPHANAWFPVAAKLAGVPAVVTTEHILFPERHRRDDLRKRFTRRFVDRAIAVSSAIGGALIGQWGYRERQVRVIPNGVDIARFAGRDPRARARAREHLRVPHDAILVGGVGRLEEQKGFVYLVRAAARLVKRHPRLRIAIAGTGSLASALEAEARESGAGDALLLPGRVDAIPEFLAALDLFVLPSLWEGMPLSLLEAMAMGVPVIASETPGAAEILGADGRAGILVGRADDAAIAAAIERIIGDPLLASALGRYGFDLVRREHDLARLFPRLLGVYGEALAAGVP